MIGPASSKSQKDRSPKQNSAGGYREAVEAPDTAIKLDPEIASAWNSKNMARIGLGELAAALQSLAVKRESRLRNEAVRGPERNSLRGYSEFKKIVL